MMTNGTVIALVTMLNGQSMGKFNVKERMPLTKREDYPDADFLECKFNEDSMLLEATGPSTEREWNEQEMEYQIQQIRKMNAEY